MTLREMHAARHETLNAALDELVADYLACHGGKMPSTTTVIELLEWSDEQRTNPTEPPGREHEHPDVYMCAHCGEPVSDPDFHDCEDVTASDRAGRAP